MIHHAVGKAWLIGHDQLNVIVSRNVGGGDDRELAPIDAAVKADGSDEAARDGTAHGRSMPHAFALNVVHIARPPQQLIHSLLAGDGGANDAGCLARVHGLGKSERPYGLRHSIHRRGPVAKRMIYAANPASVRASTCTPLPIHSGRAYSSGRWLTPPRQGMNSIATGAMRAIKSES